MSVVDVVVDKVFYGWKYCGLVWVVFVFVLDGMVLVVIEKVDM